jgi:hypothetical protein
MLDLAEGDIGDILDAAQEELPDIEDLTEQVESGLQEGLRLMAININIDYLRDGNPPNVNVLYLEDRSVRGLPMEFVIEALAQGLEKMIPGLNILDKSVEENANGIEYGNLLSQLTSASNVTVSQRQVYFNVPGGMAVITFSADPRDFDSLNPAFQDIVDSFILLDD